MRDPLVITTRSKIEKKYYRKKQIYPLSFSFFYKLAGLVSISKNEWAFHLFPSYHHWVWGHKLEEYDMLLEYYGCGFFFLVVKLN